MDNIDKYGHCVVCHRNLIVERVAEGKVIKMFLPEKEETDFLLNDGSRMRVCICRTCKREKDFTDKKLQEQIMEAVIAGWQLEVDTMVADENKPEWTPERAKAHMEVYGKKSLLLHSENADKHVIEKHQSDVLRAMEEALEPKVE